MEVFMRDVDQSTSRNRLIVVLAKILHGPRYSKSYSRPINFHVFMFKDKSGLRLHAGLGTLTLPSEEIGRQFLFDYGGTLPTYTCVVGPKRIQFSQSNRPTRTEVLESISLLPYVDPAAAEAQEKEDHKISSASIAIRNLQFGWQCRDPFFSIEWEQVPSTCTLTFDNQPRALRITLHPYSIVIRLSQIQMISAHTYLSSQPVIYMTLLSPPTFESITTTPRTRLAALPISDHARVAPYVSHALRLVCVSPQDLDLFRNISKVINLRHITDLECGIQRRDLFSAATLEQLDVELLHLDWCVAFQVVSLLRNLSVDTKEILSLIPQVKELVRRKNSRYAASVLRYFGPQARELYWLDPGEESETLLQCFKRVEREFENQSELPALLPTDTSHFEAYHVDITPTSMQLSGPHPERSNRVIRRYGSNHHESFLRVNFNEEGRLRYHFDRDIDGQGFVHARVGPILRYGLTIAGRIFQFLAYSQSSLKEHSVWFVKPFRDAEYGVVDASVIIRNIGSFDKLAFDPKLMYCPARYGARISQAFTATDSSVTIEDVEEIFFLRDIWTDGHEYCFTDGVGTISKELAKEMSKELRIKRHRGRHRKGYSRAFQVRFQGSKGMLSVDHTLRGRAICLRDSMIKFEAPESREIDVAQAFTRPSPYFLNRPLIMLLENLGVEYEVFKKFQDRAILEVKRSSQSLGRAGRMLETHGLGTSFRLASVMLNLEKLGLDNMHNQFYNMMLELAIHHVLRVLKNHARIPIPDAWTLVGIADVHGILQEDEIFACVKTIDGDVVYLDGPVLISRSPTIHPGDVQIASAIGIPSPGSCFYKEPLYNTVVFSVRGSRPLPSYLGGGDLDGDMYNIIPLKVHPEFMIPRTFLPANYEAAQKKLLPHPCTMRDVAEFVMEYINSDVVGIVAITWLIVADQSQQGIFDPDCLKLSQLHNVAVDYPKSGHPVPLNDIPKLKFNGKPDWSAPETVNPDTTRYYQSKRAIGRLFRDVKLPAIQTHTKQRKQTTKVKADSGLSRAFDGLSLQDSSKDDDVLQEAVEERVCKFVDITRDMPNSGAMVTHIRSIYDRYGYELKSICATYTLSYSPSATLMEEEVVIGTIVQKTSQPRQRANMIAKLREQTDLLIRGIREELQGHDDESIEHYLLRAWIAWKISTRRGTEFGAKSFGWLALGAIFDAIKEIEEAQQLRLRSRVV